MRGRLIIALAIAALAVAVALVVSGGDDPTVGTARGPSERPRSGASFPSREVQAGEVTVIAELTGIDGAGAEVELTFDTHSVELDFDVVASTELTVDGKAWDPLAWDGDGPSGHHRSGTVRFSATGPAQGRVTLRVTGTPEPAEATWTIPAG
ncbi:MAG: hypothetical protein HYU28_09095 [Actinobacteria bacterium]|nr:hypothetical protein [Actinomycetota bacterium]